MDSRFPIVLTNILHYSKDNQTIVRKAFEEHRKKLPCLFCGRKPAYNVHSAIGAGFQVSCSAAPRPSASDRQKPCNSKFNTASIHFALVEFAKINPLPGIELAKEAVARDPGDEHIIALRKSVAIATQQLTAAIEDSDTRNDTEFLTSADVGLQATIEGFNARRAPVCIDLDMEALPTRQQRGVLPGNRTVQLPFQRPSPSMLPPNVQQNNNAQKRSRPRVEDQTAALQRPNVIVPSLLHNNPPSVPNFQKRDYTGAVEALGLTSSSQKEKAVAALHQMTKRRRDHTDTSKLTLVYVSGIQRMPVSTLKGLLKDIGIDVTPQAIANISFLGKNTSEFLLSPHIVSYFKKRITSLGLNNLKILENFDPSKAADPEASEETKARINKVFLDRTHSIIQRPGVSAQVKEFFSSFLMESSQPLPHSQTQLITSQNNTQETQEDHQQLRDYGYHSNMGQMELIVPETQFSLMGLNSFTQNY